MKNRAALAAATALSLAATPAFAVSTNKVYNSGILVLLFLGFCALVVVFQMIPAIMILFGMIKEAVKGVSGNTQTAEATEGSKSFFDRS